MPTIDWQQVLAESRFDNRGARLEWALVKLRVHGEVRPGLLFNAPRWIRLQLEPFLQQRRARLVRLTKQPPSAWMYAYQLSGPIDDEMSRLLVLLGEVISIGRIPQSTVACMALDMYKRPDEQLDPMEWPNTPAGDLINRYKYWSPPACNVALQSLVVRLARVIKDHPSLRDASCVTSVPGRDGTKVGHGERLAGAVAAAAGKPFLPSRGLYGERDEAKAGFVMQPSDVAVPPEIRSHPSVIVVDDVFRSGHSLGVVAGHARSFGVSQVFGLVGAKTLKN